jgi:phosphatidylglycerophosphate synthase
MNQNATLSETLKADIRMAGNSWFARAVNRIVTFKHWCTPVRALLLALPSWVTPNRITIFGIALVAPTVWTILEKWWWTALALSALSILLDFMDGALAEVRNQRTPLGAILDPIRDKILVVSVLIALAVTLPSAFLWLIVPMAVLEACIMTMRGRNMRERAAVLDDNQPVGMAALARHVSAKWPGKMKMVAESVAVLALLPAVAVSATPLLWVGFVALAAAVGFGCASLYSQVRG